jgi:N-methylhydantoinase A
VTLRVTVVAPAVPPPIPQESAGPADASGAVVGQKQVWFKQQPQTATLYERAKLRPGNQFSGPAIVFQYDTTVVIPPDWETAVDSGANLVITWRG